MSFFGTVSISEMTYERTGHEFLGRELDLVRVKGKDQPVKIFELLARKGKAFSEREVLAEGFQAALAEYRKRNWDKAREAFHAVLIGAPQDGPAKLYLNRWEILSSSPPPEDWDGVYTMTTK